jgi:RimJ/RimL family protein N-acetyltransferase
MPSNLEPVLQTARLLLRPLRLDDAPDFVRLLGADEDAVSRMSHMPWPCTREAAEAWILTGFHAGARIFAVVRAADDRFLGAMGFGGSPLRPSVGYWIGRPFWRQGFATEALGRILAYARSLGAAGAEAETFPGNTASERVLEKSGFRRGMPARRYCPGRGGMRDVLTWSLEF